MIKVFDSPTYMTVEEVQEKYYPYRVLMVNCDERNHRTIGGYVLAMETIPDDDYPELFDMLSALVDEKKHGRIDMVLTRLPHEGEWQCVGFAQ